MEAEVIHATQQAANTTALILRAVYTDSRDVAAMLVSSLSEDCQRLNQALAALPTFEQNPKLKESYTVVDECSESIQKVVKRIDYDEEVKTLCTSESRRLANAFREISSIVDPHNLRRRKKSFASSIVKSASPHPSSPTTYSEGQKQQQYNKEVEAEIEKHLSTTVKEQIGPSVHDQLPNTKSFLQLDGGNSPNASDSMKSTSVSIEKEVENLKKQVERLQREKQELKTQLEESLSKHQEMMLLSINYMNTSAEPPDLPEEIRDFRDDLKVKLEREFLRIFPNSKIPRFIERLLVQSQLQLLHALVQQLEGVDLNKFANALVCIFESNGKSLRLMRWAISQEVNRCAYAPAIFREDSLYAKIFRVYFALVGRNYLSSILLPVIKKIGNTKQSYEEEESRAVNVKKLRKRLVQVLDTIFSTLSECPIQIRMICWYLGAEVESKFPGEGSKVVGGFLFLKFFCPALVTPQLFDVSANKEGIRGLILLSKVLQTIANQSLSMDIQDIQSVSAPVIRERFAEFITEFSCENAGKLRMEHTKISEEKREEAVAFVTEMIKSRVTTLRPLLEGSDELLGALSVAMHPKPQLPSRDTKPPLHVPVLKRTKSRDNDSELNSDSPTLNRHPTSSTSSAVAKPKLINSRIRSTSLSLEQNAQTTSSMKTSSSQLPFRKVTY